MEEAEKLFKILEETSIVVKKVMKGNEIKKMTPKISQILFKDAQMRNLVFFQTTIFCSITTMAVVLFDNGSEEGAFD